MLRDFQRSFASGLLNEQANRTGLSVDERGFRVHACNVQVSLRIAIESAFPVTKRLVGTDFFAAMAEEFVATHPPTHGWLSAYGVGFPHFVAQYRSAADLGYLPDIARIEWARLHAANAPDEPGLDLKTLASMAPEVLERLPLSLHAATSLVSSPFPVFDIWRAHLHANTDEQLAQIDLAKGSQCVLISRTGTLETAVTLLGPGDAALLTAIAGHLPFGAACEAAVLAEPGFDLGSGLGKLALIRALAAFVGTL